MTFNFRLFCELLKLENVFLPKYGKQPIYEIYLPALLVLIWHLVKKIQGFLQQF